METRKVIKEEAVTVTRVVVEVYTTFYRIHIPEWIEITDIMVKDFKKLGGAIVCRDYADKLCLISIDKLFIMSVAKKWHVPMMEVYDRVRVEYNYK